MGFNRSLKLGLICSLSYQLLLQPMSFKNAAQAQETGATGSSGTSLTSSQSGTSSSSNPIQLDLSSTQANLQAANNTPVNIQVGGSLVNGVVTGGSTSAITPGQMLTPAQYLAVSEVMSGQQTILIGAQGQATGGFSSINSGQISQLGSLVIPQNVSLGAIGYNSNSPLNISGSVNVLGSLYSLQTAPNVAAVLNLGNLNVGSGGLLSGYLPTNINFGSSIFASNGMTLNVVNNVLNMGTITTPGTLNIIAGGSITNQSVNNIAATISAQTINIMAATGQFINSGLITANTNLNISTLLGKDLVLDNTSGVLQALNGSINFRDTLFSGKENLSVSGGDFIAKELNLNGGDGIVEAHFNSSNALTNITAGIVHIGTATGDLNIGDMAVSGDPLVYNMGGAVALGNVSFTGADLGIYAQSTVTVGSINLVPAAAAGSAAGNLLIVGGATITGGVAGQQSVTAAPAITITGASGLAGNVSVGNINTSGGQEGTFANHNGGYVNIAAYNGTITTGTITTGGKGTGSNGAVTLVAGANPGVGNTTITTGAISTIGGTGGGGAVDISTATPAATLPFTVTPTAAFFLPAAPAFTRNAAATRLGDISAQAISTEGAAISLIAGGNLNLNSQTVSSTRSLTSGQAGAIQLVAGAPVGSTGAVSNLGSVLARGNSLVANTVNAGNAVTIIGRGGVSGAGPINTSAVANGIPAAAQSAGSVAILSGAGNINISGSVTANGAGTGAGNGGNVFVLSGNNFTDAASAATVTLNASAGGTGGSITTGDINSSSNSTTGAGGAIQMGAWGTNGAITVNGTLRSRGGSTSGNSGNLTLLSQGTGATSINVTGAINTDAAGTGSGTGNVVAATGNPAAAAITLTKATAATSAALAFTYNTGVINANPGISLQDVTTNAGSIQVIAGGNLSAGNVTATRNTGAGAGGVISLVAGANSASTGAGSITALGSVTSNGRGAGGNGGAVLLATGTGATTISNPVTSNTDGLNSTTGGNITILGGGNLTVNGAISSRNSAGNAAQSTVSISSGANWTLSSATNIVVGSTSTAANGALTIGSTINTRSLTATGASGNIRLAAFGPSGTITVNNALNLGAAGGALNNGNFVAIAQGNPGAASDTITFGAGAAVSTVGSTNSSGGTITIATANPLAANANITVGAPAGPAIALNYNAAINRAGISTQALTTDGQAINVLAGGNLNLNSQSVSSRRVNTTGQAGAIQLIAGAPTTSTGAISNLGSIDTRGNAIAAGTVGAGNAITIIGRGGVSSAAGTTIQSNAVINGAPALAASGGNVAIISGNGNINLAPSGIVTSGVGTGAGNGGNVFVLSGNNFGDAGGATVTLNASASVTGGAITTGSITTSSGSTTGAAGSVQLGAWGSAGSITVDGGIASLGGSTSGNSGTVTLVAQGTAVTSINVTGNINTATTGTGAATGAITIATCNPAAAAITLTKASANLSAALSYNYTTAVLNANPGISVQNLTTNAGLIRVVAGGNLSAGTVTATRTTGAGAGGLINLIAGANTTSTGAGSITALGSVTSNGRGAGGNGGAILIAMGTGATTLANSISSNGYILNSSSGGNITILGGGNLTLNGAISSRNALGNATQNSVFISSGTNWTLSAANNIVVGSTSTAANGALTIGSTINTTPQTATGAGGNIRLAAFGPAGTITVNGAQTLGAGGAFNNGNFIAIAQGNPAVAADTITFGAGATVSTVGSSTSASGTITIATANPLTANANVSLSTPAGPAIALNYSAAINRAGISTQALTTDGQSINVIAGGNLNLNSQTVSTKRVNTTGQAGVIQLIAGAPTTSTGAISNLGNVDARGTALAAGTVGAGNAITIIGRGGVSSAAGTTIQSNAVINGAPALAASGGNVAIISGNGNINLAPSGIVTSGVGTGAGNGGNVFVLSGNNFSDAGSAATVTLNAGASGTGGSVTTGNITTSAGSNTGAAGTVQLGAWGTDGTITVNGSVNSLGGSTSGNSGNVTLVAQGTAATSITVTGNISTATAGTGAATGTITIATGNPAAAAITLTKATATPGAALSFNYNAAVLNANSGISVQNLTTNAASIQVIAGGNLSAGTVTATRATGAGAGGVISLIAGANTASTGAGSITSLGAVTSNGFGAGGNGGAILIATGTGATTLANSISSNGHILNSSAGGNITIFGGGNLTLNGAISSRNALGNATQNSVFISSGTNWTLSAANNIVVGSTSTAANGALTIGSTINTTPQTATGAGGNIRLAAFGSSGTITVNGAQTLGAGGAFNNGNFIAIAQGNPAAAANTITFGAGATVSTVGSSTSASGTITIATADPLAANANITVNAPAGPAIALNYNAAIDKAGISTQVLTTDGQAINVIAGGNLNLNSQTVSTKRVNTTGQAGAIQLIAGAPTTSTGAISNLGNVDARGTALAAGTVGAGNAITIIGRGGVSSAVGTTILSNAVLNGAPAVAASGGNVAIISGNGNINIAPSGIVTSGVGTGAGNGGNVFVLSGNNFSDAGSAATVTLNAGASGTGGSVTTGNITTSAGSTTGAAGTVQLGAWGTDGTITVNGSVNSLGGSTSGNSGNVILVAQGTAATSITVTGNISTATAGTGAATGTITIATGNPAAAAITLTKATATPGAALSFNYNAAVLNANSGISLQNLTTNAASIQVIAGGNLSAGTVTATRTTGAGTGGVISLIAGANSASTGAGSITSLGAVTSNGFGAGGNGGAILIATGTGATTLANPISSNGHILNSSAGGNITILGGGDLTLNGAISSRNALGNATQNSVFISSGTNWTLSAANNIVVGSTSTAANGALTVGSTINTTPQTATGAGGNIRLAAFGPAGTITVNGAQTLGAGGAFNNGNFIAIAQSNPALAADTITFGAGATVSTVGSSTSASGTITIATANPLAANANITVNVPAGPAIALNYNAAIDKAGISTQALTTDGQAITVLAGGNLNLNSQTVSTKRVNTTGQAGAIQLIAGAPTTSSGAISNLGNIDARGNALAAGTVGAGNAITIIGRGGVSSATGTTIQSNAVINGAPALAASGGNVAIVSGNGDINIAPSGIVTSGVGNGAGNGGNVFIMSGDNFGDAGAATVTLNVGASGTGGAITTGFITTSAGSSTGSAGSVQLGAWGSGGSITVNGAIASLGGSVSGASGDVSIVSAGTGATSITVTGNVNTATAGSGSGTGKLTIATGTPLSSAITLTRATAATSGSISFNMTAAVVDANPSLSLQALSTNGAAIQVIAGGNVSIAGATATRTTGAGAGGNINLIAGVNSTGPGSGSLTTTGPVASNGFGGNGGNILLASGTDTTTISSSISSNGGGAGAVSGGNISVLAAGDLNINAAVNSRSQNGGVAAHTITLMSGANWTMNAVGTQITIGTTGGAQGALSVNGPLTTISLAGVGAGGNVQLGAFGNNGTINVTVAPFTGGTGAANGDFTAIAQANPAGDSIVLPAINTTGGTTGTGNITVYTGAPLSSAATVLLSSPSVAAFGLSNFDNAITSAGIKTLDLSTNGARVAVFAAGDLSLGNVSTTSATFGGVVDLFAGFRQTGGAGTGAITSLGSIDTKGSNGNGGALTIGTGSNPSTINTNLDTSAGGTGSGGNINLIAAGALNVNGNMTSNGAGGGNGGKLTIATGADYTVDTVSSILTVTNAGSGAAGPLAITGSIDTRALAANGSGGNVQLAAFGAGGTISVTGGVQTAGAGTATNGSFTAVGAGSNVTTGAIDTTNGGSGGSGGGGSITIATATPISTVTVNLTSGAVAGTFTPDYSAINANGDVSTSALRTNGADITVAAGRNINFNGGSVNASRITGSAAGGNISINAGLANTSGQITNLSAVSANGAANVAGVGGDGGKILITAPQSLSFAPASSVSANGVSNGAGAGNGGRINILSGLDLSITGSVSATGGASAGNGGSILLAGGADFSVTNALVTLLPSSASASGVLSISGSVDSRAGAASNGNGGSIQIGAFGAGGAISISGSIFSAGAGSGNNGDVVVVAAGNPLSGTSVQITGAVNTASQGASNNGLTGSISIGSTDPLTANLTIARPSGVASSSFAVNTGVGQVKPDTVITSDLTSNGAAIIVVGGANATTGNVSTDRSAGAGSGDVTLTAGSVLQAGSVSANGLTGAGGTIKMTGGVQVLSNAITSNGSSGGSITVTAGNVVAPTHGIQISGAVTANGASAAGGSILIDLQGEGTLTVAGNTSADALGAAGNGGSIDLRYNSTTLPFTVGAVSLNGVSGSIHADALGAGNGNSISIKNNAAADLVINGASDISTRSLGGGTLGTLNFNQAGQQVLVNTSGQLLGLLNAGGSVVSVTTTAAATTLTANNVQSTVGAVTLMASGAGSQINIQGPVDSATTVSINADGSIARTNMAGVVSSTGLATLKSNTGDIGAAGTPIFTKVPNITLSATAGSAYIQQQSGDITVSTSTVLDTLNLQGADSIDISNDLSATGAAGLIAVSAAGAGNITQTNQTASVKANTVQLTSVDGNIGGIVALTNPIRTNTGTGGLTLNSKAAGNGGAFIQDISGALNLNASTLGGALRINSADITTTGDISANGGITFNTPALHNSFVVNGNAAFTIQNASGVLVDDPSSAGTIQATTITATSSGGSVDMTQDNWIGSVTGSASTSFSVISCCSGLAAKDITAGGDISLVSSFTLDTSGNIVSTGGDINLESFGDFDNTGTLNAQGGGIQGLFFSGNSKNSGTMLAGKGDLNLATFIGDLVFAAGSNTTASANVILNSANNINIGAAAGAATVLSAGQATTNGLQLMQQNSVNSNGAVQIQSNGNFTVFDNVSITSRGGGGAAPAGTGDLWVDAGANVSIGSNNTLTSFGGFNMLSAVGTLLVGSSQINSVAKLTDAGGNSTNSKGVVYPNTTGGGVGLLSGSNAGHNYLTTQLNTLLDNRTMTPQYQVAGTPFNTSSPNLNVSGGSIIQSVFAGTPPQINPDAPNFYVMSNGVAYFENQNSTLSLNNSTVNVTGAAFIPPPPVPTGGITGASNGSASSGNTNLFGLGIFGSGFVNTGVPTDRINYTIDISNSNQVSGQNLTVGDRRTWFVAEGPSQPFVLENDDTFIVGQEGSQLSLVDTRNVLLEQGRLAVLVSNKADLLIETNLGSLSVPAGGVAIVDTTDPSQVRIINLSQSAIQMSVTGSDGNKQSIVVLSGEELVVSRADSIYSPKDELSRTPIASNTTVAGLKVSKNAINKAEVVENERLLSCGGKSDCLTKRRVDALKSSLNSDRGNSSSLNSNSLSPKSMRSAPHLSALSSLSSGDSEASSTADSALTPVSFSSSLGATAANFGKLMTLHTNTAAIKHRGAELQLSGDSLNLLRGEVLVLTKRPTAVRTGNSTVIISPGTVVLISKDNLSTKVRTIWEAKAGCVRQYFGKNHIEIGAGQESLLAREESAIHAVHASDEVGRRRVRNAQIENHRLSTAEISLITLMSSSPVLKEIAHASDDASASLKNKILKMAACIQSATAAHGNYGNMSRR